MRNAPQFAEQYKSEILTNPNVEMIHISLDRSDKAALSWAKSFNQPWPIMLPQGMDRKKLVDPYGVRGAPTYILVDLEGKELARGKGPVFAKAKASK